MKESIKKRIEAVRHGEGPEGDTRTDSGVMPEEWPNSTIGKIIVFHSEKSTINNQYPVLTSAKSGLALQTEYFEDQVTREENAGYNVIPRGYVTYRSRSDDGRFTFNQNQIVEKGIVSCFYPVFRIIEDLADPTFVLSYLNNYLGRQIMKEIVGTSQLVLSEKKLSALRLPCPPLAEQKKISAILATCDRVIELKQGKIDELNKLKQTCLRKMFPQKGQTVPEIRFPGFSDPWEQRKFSDLAETRRGLTYNPTNIRENGVRVLRSSNIDEDHFVCGDEDVFVVPNVVNIPYVRNGDILITSANGSTRLVGKHAIIREMPDKSAVHGGFMLLASAQNPEFVNALMGAPWYAKFIALYVAGGNGAIGNLNKNDLDEQDVFVPSDAEQKVIGAYFQNLDHLITLHQRELEEYEKYKKTLMQLLLTGLVRVNA